MGGSIEVFGVGLPDERDTRKIYRCGTEAMQHSPCRVCALKLDALEPIQHPWTLAITRFHRCINIA